MLAKRSNAPGGTSGDLHAYVRLPARQAQKSRGSFWKADHQENEDGLGAKRFSSSFLFDRELEPNPCPSVLVLSFGPSRLSGFSGFVLPLLIGQFLGRCLATSAA